MHYAALDAFCLIQIAEKLVEKAVKLKNGVTLRSSMRELENGEFKEKVIDQADEQTIEKLNSK